MSDDVYIDPAFRLSNRLEAALWITIGMIVLVRGWRKGAALAPMNVTLVLALFAFGTSDLVEAHSGAWWRPWWLLVWKGVCVLTIAPILIKMARFRQKASNGAK